MDINGRTRQDTETQKIIRDLIDFQFKSTKKFYMTVGILYVLTYCLPLIYILFNEVGVMKKNVTYCLYSCMSMQILLFYFEFINIKADGMGYFTDIFNVNDLLGQIAFYVLFTFKMLHGNEHQWQPNYKKSDPVIHINNWQLFDQILRMILVIIMITKINFFFKVNAQFGQLRLLITTCLEDITPFTIYLMIWIFGMSLMYKVLGMSSKGYQGITDNILINFFL